MICLTASTILPTCMDSLTTAQAATATSGTKVKLNKTKATIYNGATLQLKLKGTNEKVKWSSSSKKIATVDKNGKVTAKKKGKATITAKIGKKKYTCKLTVEPAFELFTGSDKSISLDEGNEYAIELLLKVKKMGKGVTYSNSNKKVVKCKWEDKYHDSLMITGLKPGKATITFKNAVSNDVIKVKVTVKEFVDLEQLEQIMGMSIAQANTLFSSKLMDFGDGTYMNSFMAVEPDSNGLIKKIYLLEQASNHTLFRIWPGLGYSYAKAVLESDGWKKISETGSGCMYVHSDHPGFVLFTKELGPSGRYYNVKGIVYGLS